MTIKNFIRGSAAAIVLGLAGLVVGTGTANASSLLINGGTCVPYPNFGASNVGAVAYKHWLYGFKQSAYCHLDLQADTSASDIVYAVVDGRAPSTGSIKLRLCTYRSGSLATSCGTQKTLSGNNSIGLLYPPNHGSNNPPYGAFIQVNFPDTGASTIRSIVVAFSS